ncbi:Tn7 transposase TnsA N-terminal domain-containing protein [Shewanella baltica]|uniref:Tn7 transposase TnsA N-terminal domain-containing protein n=1 Tax=Shewanella baltica TaxID=62322 RepID=UPI0039B0DED4
MSNKYKANKSRGRHVYQYFSQKNQAPLKVESFLELCVAAQMECEPNIVAYAAQPESLHLHESITNKTIRYTPDFLIKYANGTAAFIEVHHSSHITKDFQSRLALFNEYSLKTANVPIVLVDERQLTPMIYTNLQLIANRRSARLSCTLNHADLPELLTFEALVDWLKPRSQTSVGDAYHLVGAGFYQFDKSQLLLASTTLNKVMLS